MQPFYMRWISGLCEKIIFNFMIDFCVNKKKLLNRMGEKMKECEIVVTVCIRVRGCTYII